MIVYCYYKRKAKVEEIDKLNTHIVVDNDMDRNRNVYNNGNVYYHDGYVNGNVNIYGSRVNNNLNRGNYHKKQ